MRIFKYIQQMYMHLYLFSPFTVLCQDKNQVSFFHDLSAYYIYFPLYFLLALERSCFINESSFYSVFKLLPLYGFFQSAYKHIQMFLIKHMLSLYVHPYSFVHPCIYPSLLKYLKKNIRSHPNHFFTI